MVFVVDTEHRPLSPCHPARARRLLSHWKAAVWRCYPFTIILNRDENAARNILWRGQRLRGLAGLPAGMNREPVGL